MNDWLHPADSVERSAGFARRLLVRPVKIHAPRQGKADLCCSVDPRHHCHSVVPKLPPFAEVGIIMGTLPFAMIGAIWLMYLLDYNFSVSVGVGFIALVGVAVEIGVIMLAYLNQSYQSMLETCEQKGLTPRRETLRHAVLQGAGLRVRPVMMTAAASSEAWCLLWLASVRAPK